MNCFHKCEQINRFVIRKCEIKKCEDNKYYHVIHFREPIDESPFKDIQSIKCHYTITSQVDEVWEELTGLPISSVYALGMDTNSILITDIITQMIQSICNITLLDYVYILLVRSTPSSIKQFLQNIAAVIEDSNNSSFRYIQLNRFLVKPVSQLTTVTKYRLLKLQIFSIIDILKYLLYQKLSVKEAKNVIYPNCHKCKLIGYGERFLNTNTIDMHTLFCQSQKLEQIENIPCFFKNAKINIYEALTYLKNMNNAIMTSKSKR